jgi:hypothetical protein
LNCFSALAWDASCDTEGSKAMAATFTQYLTPA